MSVAIMNSVPTPTELQSYQIIAEVAASNQYWRKLGGNGDQKSVVATILSVMLLARELGISPMQAISGGINNIQGKFEISARLMNQLIRMRGHKIEIRMSTNEACVIWSKRRDTGEEYEARYTIDEAQRSGLVKDGSAWKKVPSDMLFARCISRMARRLYADCIGGCYIEGELQESIEGKSVKPDELNDLVKTKNEIDVTPEPVITLALPDHVSSDEVERFIKESAERSKVTVGKVKQKAAENMDLFLQRFDSWKAKQAPIEISIQEPEDTELLA